MSARRNRLAHLLPLAVTFLLASCTGSTEVCDPNDALCGDNGGGVPQASIADVAVTEGDAGTVDAVFTVTLSATSGQTVTVDYATADGTAVAPGDYTPASGRLTFSSGSRTRTITVLVQGDLIDEVASETFTVALSAPTNATIGDGSATGTITDDDNCPVLGTLVVGAFVSGALGPGDCQLVLQLYLDHWTLEVATQSTIQIDLVSNDFDAFLGLDDGSSMLLDSDDDSGVDTNSRIVATLSAGTYTILASSFAAGETGNYQLSVGFPAPVISNLSMPLVQVSDPACVPVNGGSSFNISFDFTDADGDVTAGGSSVDWFFVFLPSGTAGGLVPSVSFTGTSSSGTVAWGTCTVFGPDTSVDITVSLTDDAGLTSNSLQINVPRPPLAPAGASPSAVATARLPGG